MAADETGAQLQQQQQHWGWTRRAEGNCNSRLTVSQPVVVGFPFSLFPHYLSLHLPLSLFLPHCTASLWRKFKRLSRGYFPNLCSILKCCTQNACWGLFWSKWLKNVDDDDDTYGGTHTKWKPWPWLGFLELDTNRGIVRVVSGKPLFAAGNTHVVKGILSTGWQRICES